MVPVLLRYERGDLVLTVDYQPEGNRLHPPGRQAAAHLLPQHGAQVVPDKAVQDAPRLLRVE